MPPRFEYNRLEPGQLAQRLVKLDLQPNTFARIFGVRKNTINKWLTEGNIPPWVDVVLDMLELPGAFAAARTSAARIIRTDNLRPGTAYPYGR